MFIYLIRQHASVLRFNILVQFIRTIALSLLPETLFEPPDGMREQPEGIFTLPEAVREQPDAVREPPEGEFALPEGMRESP